MTWEPCFHFLPEVCWHFKWMANQGSFWPRIFRSLTFLRMPGWGEEVCVAPGATDSNPPTERYWSNEPFSTHLWYSCCPYRILMPMTVFSFTSAIVGGFYVILLYKNCHFKEILFSSVWHCTDSKTEERTKPKEKKRTKNVYHLSLQPNANKLLQGSYIPKAWI